MLVGLRPHKPLYSHPLGVRISRSSNSIRKQNDWEKVSQTGILLIRAVAKMMILLLHPFAFLCAGETKIHRIGINRDTSILLQLRFHLSYFANTFQLIVA